MADDEVENKAQQRTAQGFRRFTNTLDPRDVFGYDYFIAYGRERYWHNINMRIRLLELQGGDGQISDVQIPPMRHRGCLSPGRWTFVSLALALGRGLPGTAS